MAQIDSARISAAVEIAQFDFWAKIAELFPEIKTGDWPPDCSVELDRALEDAVAVWIDLNKND